jgi:putative Mg2+ transporter-C (MgtC) family protein
VEFVNRRPITAGETEALYRVHLVCRPQDVSRARDLLFEELEQHQHPIQDIETLSENEDLVELAAALVSGSADAAELDLIVEHLDRSAFVVSATWTVSTTS